MEIQWHNLFAGLWCLCFLENGRNKLLLANNYNDLMIKRKLFFCSRQNYTTLRVTLTFGRYNAAGQILKKCLWFNFNPINTSWSFSWWCFNNLVTWLGGDCSLMQLVKWLKLALWNLVGNYYSLYKIKGKFEVHMNVH